MTEDKLTGLFIGMLIGMLVIYGVPIAIGYLFHLDDDDVLALHGVTAFLLLIAAIIMIPSRC